jgi:hypothetical protein
VSRSSSSRLSSGRADARRSASSCVAFAASMAGVETQLVAYGRLCSTMLGDPNIHCRLRLRERDGMQSLTMTHAALHLLGTAASRAPKEGRATACRQESMACH